MSVVLSTWSEPTSASAEELEVVEALLDSFAAYAADHIDAARIDADSAIPPQILRDLAEMGLFGLSIPERFGGVGFSLGSVCALVQGIARYDRSVGTTVGLHLGLGTRGLVRFGTPSLQERLLPDMATGERIAAFAATEAGAGSDLYAMGTSIERRPNDIRVNGSKIFVTNGGLADVFTVVGQERSDDGRRKHSVVVLEKGDAGVEPFGEEHKLGLRGSSTTTLTLDDVCVPTDRLVAPPGEGMPAVGHILAWGRTAMAAGCVGTAAEAHRRATLHTAERRQFGKTLDSFEVVQRRLMGMRALLFAMESLVQRTAAAPDDDVLDHRSIAAKILCSEGNWEVCDASLQLFGGSGFIEETGIPLLLRDARITRIFEGANDVLLGHLGQRTAMTRDLPGTLGARRDELWARFKMRLIRKHGLLHQLGRLAVLHESVVAAEERAAAQPEHRPVAAFWSALAQRRMADLLLDPLELPS